MPILLLLRRPLPVVVHHVHPMKLRLPLHLLLMVCLLLSVQLRLLLCMHLLLMLCACLGSRLLLCWRPLPLALSARLHLGVHHSLLPRGLLLRPLVHHYLSALPRRSCRRRRRRCHCTVRRAWHARR